MDFNLIFLTDFVAPGPYRIQFMASYFDLCTPISPANMHDAILKILDSETCSSTPTYQTFYHRGYLSYLKKKKKEKNFLSHGLTTCDSSNLMSLCSRKEEDWI